MKKKNIHKNLIYLAFQTAQHIYKAYVKLAFFIAG